MRRKEKPLKWETYEEVATHLLNDFKEDFGLSKVEGKQKVIGHNTEWEIDAKGTQSNDEGFVIIECRRHTKSRQSQEQLGGLAYRIRDTGAEGGILVSPLGFQEGARRIASSENIIEVRLNPDCSAEEFCMTFLNKLMIGLKDIVSFKDEASATIYRVCKHCGNQFTPKKAERLCPKCLK